MRQIADLLAEQSVFAGLDASDLQFIAGCGVNTSFASGDFLLREGDPRRRSTCCGPGASRCRRSPRPAEPS